jgi:hypothetical protein
MDNEINKDNWKIFCKNNDMSLTDYPYGQYVDDMTKERAKDEENFNPRF